MKKQLFSFYLPIIIIFIVFILVLVYPFYISFIDSSTEKNLHPSLGINKKMQSRIDYNNHIWMEGNTIYGSIKLRKINNQIIDTVIKLYRFIPVVGSGEPLNLVKEKLTKKSIGDSVYYRSGLKIDSFLIGTTEVSDMFWFIFRNRDSILRYNDSSAFYMIFPKSDFRYEECVSFIEELSSVLKRKFRLPTFHEWIFAASGGVKSKGYVYSGSNDIGEVAWYKLNVIPGLLDLLPPGNVGHPMAYKKPNELGIYDMSGNAAEFTSTLYGNFYSEIGFGNINSWITKNSNSDGLEKMHSPITMGGDTNSDSDGCRIDLFPSMTSSSAGFRIIMEP